MRGYSRRLPASGDLNTAARKPQGDLREEGLGRGKGSAQALKRWCQKCSVTEDRVSRAEGYLLGARVSQLAWARIKTSMWFY